MEWIQVYEPSLPGGGTQFLPTPCQQCQNAPCVNVCPVGATFSMPEGVVLIDQQRCIGCRLCMEACPYDRRFFNWGVPAIPPEATFMEYDPMHQSPAQKGTVMKCDFCPDMARAGRLPYCAQGCPNHAIYYGDLEEDLATNGDQVVKLSRLLSEEFSLSPEGEPRDNAPGLLHPRPWGNGRTRRVRGGAAAYRMAVAGKDNRKRYMDKVTVRGLVLAAVLGLPAFAPGPVRAQAPLEPTQIVIGAPAQSNPAEPLTVQAVLADSQGHPISKARIYFTTQAAFLSDKGDVVLAEAVTNGNGQAVARFANDFSGSVALSAEFRGDAQYAPSNATVQLVAPDEAQLYAEHVGVDLPGFNVPPSARRRPPFNRRSRASIGSFKACGRR